MGEDITKNIRESFWEFFEIYGSKCFDFNKDGPFQKLEGLVGDEKSKEFIPKIGKG
jgi:hypothetical protein